MLLAIRLASSLVSSLAADLRGGGRPFAICHEIYDCRWDAADQKAKYDDDDQFRDPSPHERAPNNDSRA